MPWRRIALVHEIAGALQRPAHLARALPPTPESSRLLGGTLMRRGAYTRARSAMEYLLFERPDDAEAHLVLAKACGSARRTACAARRPGC